MGCESVMGREREATRLPDVNRGLLRAYTGENISIAAASLKEDCINSMYNQVWAKVLTKIHR